MKTKIKTAHEEKFTQGEKNRILGVLFNYSFEVEHDGWRESFAYTYKDGMYIFFDTIIEMINYLLYGETKMKRAYMEENDFDELYDSNFIDGKFNDKLKWTL